MLAKAWHLVVVTACVYVLTTCWYLSGSGVASARGLAAWRAIN